ncbi:hypothetical protein M569_04318, partial [Genlisea aurea]
MCHSSLEVEFGDWINFITGQNGSGKSAILAALCVAFGSRARGTQRANTMKDFIKTGCGYALVEVEIKNEGVDAFKPELYGTLIVVGRRITESSSTITLKNSQGRKIGNKKEDLREIVEHFNIDVENPCVIMTQDKSREFLHSGNAKDKFKFFFKATLLQQVNDLLKGIERQLTDTTALVSHLEDSLKPILREMDELQEKIRAVEFVEGLAQQVQMLRKKLAWAWVYDADKNLNEQLKLIGKLQGKVPSCQSRIDKYHRKMEELGDILANRKHQISQMIEKASDLRRKKEDLNYSLSMSLRERAELEGEMVRVVGQIQKMVRHKEGLDQQIHDLNEEYAGNTKAEENKLRDGLSKLQVEIKEANAVCLRLQQEENEIAQRMSSLEYEIEKISNQIESFDRTHHSFSSRVQELQMNQRNKVTAFGGGRVINLLQCIERNQHKFRMPPIGPIGAHVTLEHADLWSIAIEHAFGKLLNAFIVNDTKDARILRACCREVNYNYLQIIIYDFSRPRIVIPRHMLPQTKHPTAFSLIHSENATVLNVLVDTANAERQVLVVDYDAGRTVAFDQRIPNLKEVYTSDGLKMFSRGSSQTVLPANKNLRGGRLSGSFDNEIMDLEKKALDAKEDADQARSRKRRSEQELRELQDTVCGINAKRIKLERNIKAKELDLKDINKSLSEVSAAPVSSEKELHEEIHKLCAEIQDKESILKTLRKRVQETESKAEDLRMSFKSLCDSANSEMNALAEAERELMTIEEDLQKAEEEKKHYEQFLQNNILPEIKNAEAKCNELEEITKENRRKASIICPESEVEALDGGEESNPEHLSFELSRLKVRLERESQRFPESIDELRMLLENKKRKISRKQKTYEAFKEKMEACEKALQLRWSKFQRNAMLLKRQLTWQFNGHLKRKGVSGQITVSYEEQTLSIEIKMPQDAATHSSVQDTRGLSGGERSFSTLCFTLALHEMTEAPFRAMDEFDVYMDAISRKISMDALVEFALAHGSQWIFITPHDISMVRNDERIKKQQLAAPR